MPDTSTCSNTTGNGSVMYCCLHDQGCLVPGSKYCEVSGEKLSQSFCGVEHCSHEWTQHGTFSTQNNSIVLDLEGKDDDWYDDLAGGWLIRYFYEEIYGR